ncbi:11606_t:CDS:10 [Dentiscutata erythropus]|uniref:11606_t:CDS:1 n=1 Tax=Dentiscutata erythropus TaxID=1348616 RepID=A0A9N8WJZ2_9GLOM|nr:11606_t:CDS:10 [Dentiscutata erythropus]
MTSPNVNVTFLNRKKQRFLATETIGEPKTVKIIRYVVIFISVGLSIAVFVILCLGLRNELPSVDISYSTAKSLPTPWNYNCNNYISNTAFNTTSKKYYAGFSSSNDITTRIGYALSIKIIDPSYNITNQTDYMEMTAYDRRYDLNVIPPSGQEIQFEETLSLKNTYFFGQPRNDIARYDWVFDRCIRHALVTDVLSYFGRQKYTDIPYLDSHMSTVSTASSGLLLQFNASTPFIVTEEKEQRSKTVLTVLGNIGGIWSVVAAFYIFLFGPGLISPWGFIQTKIFKDHYKRDVLPFVYEPDTTEDFDTSIQKRLDNLEKRIQFYDKFIFDDPLINFIKKDSQPTTPITATTLK